MKSNLPELPPSRRKWLWATFWFVLLGTPPFLVFTSRLAELIPPAFAIRLSRLFPFAIFGGVLAAGYTLGFLYVRLTSRDRDGFTRDVITFGFIFFLLLVVILVVTIPFIVHEFLKG